ncbi:MMPL family transporter [Candidatus Saccharibacteria bacterium]|nr:MMPL family transporter [Candidatus Saccharibacteria bacterium]
MRKVTDFIVNHCYVIFAVFLVLTGICGILATQVHINKDIYSYMPADSETSKGLEIMNDEFNYSDTSNYEMMLTGVPDEKKLEIKKEIESVDGVSYVDYDESENYNRDQYTLYKINIDAPADSETADRVYHEIHNKYSKEYETVEAGQVRDFNGDVLQIGVALAAIAFAMVILIIMSKSWVEPFLFLFAILLAVVVNKGTNIIFPSVSHITDSIAAILQMALSMDYAIMLSTRYRQEKAKADCPDKMTAMRRAMRYSFGAISSSSVTTVVGLLMLIFMSFTIGRDMGLVLSKGVILSLVSIFTSLPALLLIFDKAIEKTAKKTINFKMDFFGKCAFVFRKLALPAFLIIFAGAFMLKGSTVVDFTASQNNRIKDVFSETNQMALVYDDKMDEDVTKICKEYADRDDTTRVLCYGNTINEPEHYNELIPKVNDLSTEKVDTEEYLIKALYYRYYRDVDAHTISLSDFVRFLQQDIFPSEHFADEVDADLVAKVNQFSYFVDQNKVNQPRTKGEIANILGVDPAKLDDVFVLYLAEQNPSTRLTTNQFARFVVNEVLTDAKYGSMVTAAQKNDLQKLLTFSNSAITNTPKTAAELAQLFGISKETVEKVFVYYGYTTTATPTASATIEQLVDFALTDENALAELGLSADQAATIKTQIVDAKNAIIAKKDEVLQKIDAAISTLPEGSEARKAAENLRAKLVEKIDQAEKTLNGSYDYNTVAGVANKIDSQIALVENELRNLDLSGIGGLDEATKTEIKDIAEKAADAVKTAREKINLGDKLDKLKNLYKIYQAETTASTTRISAKTLVDFLLAHAGDEKLKGALTPEMIAKLQQAQYIINNQNTRYSYGELSRAFKLDASKLKLVYALYEYRHVNTNPSVSFWTLINFIDEKILPVPEYASRLGEDEKTKLATIATLMRAAKAGVQYNYDALYRAILPLSGQFDENKLYLAYLYHGSLYDYDENWTLTLEVFVNFLTDKILPDSRFAARIDDETRQKVLDGRDTINSAKELLVGPNHYRMLIESYLPAEGEQTFTFIRKLKEKLGPNNKTDYFLLGDSAMAYEMSQTFSSEMDFITIITMLSIFVVVVFTFRSVFVSMLLVCVIQCAVYIVMAYLSLTGSSIYFIALIIVQAILMGATIDYAILFTSYYVENRNYFKLGVKEALINTYNKSISAILTSASILIIVTAIVGNYTSAIAGKICQSISLGTFCATIIILGLLPSLLAVLDRWIVKKPKA